MTQRARAGAAVLVACILAAGCSTPGDGLLPPDAEQVAVKQACGSEVCDWTVVLRFPDLRGDAAVRAVSDQFQDILDEDGCPRDGGAYCVRSAPETIPSFVDGQLYDGDLTLGRDWRDRYPEGERDAFVVLVVTER